VIAETREEAKKLLVQQMKDYLRRRVAFIQDANPLIARYIIEGSHGPNGAEDGDGALARIKGSDITVSQLIAEMGDAFAASSIGDDSLIVDPARIAAVATRLRLSEDAVRAAVAYYLDHKQAIRKEIAHNLRARLDAAFARLEAATGFNEDDLAKALSHVPDDAA
jgi:hypothetical protein